nr:hypothetical protein [Tanacetum cinerariifolium]
MGNKELNTIPKKESDEFIKSRVEDLVPILSESEDTSGSDNDPRLPNQEFVETPSSDEKIVSFIKNLGYKGDIESATQVITNHMHQPWRTFAAVINRCLSGKTTGLDKIRLSRAQILWGRFYNKNVDYVELLWKDFMFQIDNRNTSAMWNSPVYKTFLAYATREIPPKKARKFKKPVSLSKKKNLVVVEEPAEKPTKKPAARRQSAGVQIKDTPVSLVMRNEELNTILKKESDEFIKSRVEDLVLIPKDIECKDSYDSNLDESTFLVTPLSDVNEDEYFTPGDDVELLLHRDPSTPIMSVVSILEGFADEPPL